MLVVVIFWASTIGSLAFSIFGVLKSKYWLSLIGALLFFPISYYFDGSPTIHGYSLFLPLFQVVSAVMVWKGKKPWAWLFLLPAFGVLLWFVVVILFYQLSL